jgi:hypothetical protein
VRGRNAGALGRERLLEELDKIFGRARPLERRAARQFLHPIRMQQHGLGQEAAVRRESHHQLHARGGLPDPHERVVLRAVHAVQEVEGGVGVGGGREQRPHPVAQLQRQVLHQLGQGLFRPDCVSEIDLPGGWRHASG